MKRKLFKILLIILTFSIINVYAENIDITKDNTITLKYSYGDKNFSNINGYLYKIADYNTDGTLKYLDNFNNITDNIFNLSTTELNALATTIDNTITQKNIEKTYEGKTNDQGLAQLTQVKAGIYLLKMDKVEEKDYEYKSIPTIISIPLYDEINNQYRYDLSIVVKTEAKFIGTQTGEPTTPEPPNTVDNIVIYVFIFTTTLLTIIGLVIYIFLKKKKEGKNNEKNTN